MSRRYPMVKKMNLAAMVAALALGFGCQQRRADEAGAAWDAFVSEYIESHFVANPPSAVNAGRHEFDGKLPDWSPEGLATETGRLRSAQERAQDFDPTSLDERRRFEREYLLESVAGRLFWQ